MEAIFTGKGDHDYRERVASRKAEREKLLTLMPPVI
jgi:hypothetical protein